MQVYRWACQALATPLDHPLLPLVWQKFLQLYLRQPGPEYGYVHLVFLIMVKRNDFMSPHQHVCCPLGWRQVDVLAEGFSKPHLRLLYSETSDSEYRRCLTSTTLPARLSGYLYHMYLHQTAREMPVLTILSSLT